MAMLKKNTGFNARRLKREPLEKLFAREWDKKNKPTHGRRPTLPYLLDSFDQYNPAEPSGEEYRLAATIIQWLGSHCGQNFLLDVVQEAIKKHIPMPISRTRIFKKGRD